MRRKYRSVVGISTELYNVVVVFLEVVGVFILAVVFVVVFNKRHRHSRISRYSDRRYHQQIDVSSN